MARPLGIRFPRALCRVTATGYRREAIYEDRRTRHDILGARRALARRRYARFVAQGIGADSLWQGLRGQIYLGDEDFVRRMQSRLGPKAADDINVPRAQRRGPAPALPSIEAACKHRDQAVLAAHDTGAYS